MKRTVSDLPKKAAKTLLCFGMRSSNGQGDEGLEYSTAQVFITLDYDNDGLLKREDIIDHVSVQSLPLRSSQSL
jgi:hypothetical protein